MKKYFLPLLVALTAGFCARAQNLNTTFRAKITYPNQTLANVWGYAAGGREYALAGGALGLIIVDVTNPDAPQQIVQIPGPNNLWKEIKTYKHYAYVVSEGGQGVQIVDLSGLPSPALNYHYYTGDGSIPNPVNKIHALHIDTTKGYLYLYGGDAWSGGRARIFNLNPDPYNPHFVSVYNTTYPGNANYIHDGYVDNDTMYSAHIYNGFFSIVNMSDKNNPQLIATQPTPGLFTHNTWLSADRRVLFTTDEVNNSFLTAYDISDPSDIRLLDKIQSNPGSNAVVHNTHILGNFAVTSWYKDGFTIVDVTRPDNLVQVGNYDTYAGAGGGTEGCWGVYPFLPSGTIAATNISALGTNNGELWIITPQYVRACYLEGKITDAVTGNPINGANVKILNTTPLTQENSGPTGSYKTGQAQAGSFTVRISKAGYQSVDAPVLLENGAVTPLNVELFPEGSLAVSGQVLRSPELLPVGAASVYLYGREFTYSTTADKEGLFSIGGVEPGVYDVVASAENAGQVIRYNQKLVTDTTLTIEIFRDYRKGAKGIKTGDFLQIRENPFQGQTTAAYERPPGSGACSLLITNALGQVVEKRELAGSAGEIQIGDLLTPGAYFIGLENDGALLQSFKILKIK